MPDQITKLLDDIERLDADAEAGPWDLEPAVETQNGWSLGTVRSNTTGESVAADIYNSDGALIALSRTALPALSRALRAVLELHPRELGGTPTGDPADYCPRCMDYWPCGPAQELHKTITDALGADDD